MKKHRRSQKIEKIKRKFTISIALSIAGTGKNRTHHRKFIVNAYSTSTVARSSIGNYLDARRFRFGSAPSAREQTLVAQTLFIRTTNSNFRQYPNRFLPFLFLVFVTLALVSLTLSLSTYLFIYLSIFLRRLLRETDKAGSASTFHLHVFVRPRVMIGDRRFERARGESVEERAGRTSLRQAGSELFGSPLEIPLVPSRIRVARPLRSSAPPLTAWHFARGSISVRGECRGELQADFKRNFSVASVSSSSFEAGSPLVRLSSPPPPANVRARRGDEGKIFLQSDKIESGKRKLPRPFPDFKLVRHWCLLFVFFVM